MATADSEPLDVQATLDVRQKPWVGWALGLFFLFWAIAFAWAVWMGAQTSTGVTWLEGMFALALLGFGWLAVAVLRKAVQGRVVVVTLSPAGYHDRWANYSERVPWPEIEGIRTVHGRGAHLRLTLSAAIGQRAFGTGLRAAIHRLNNVSTKPVLVTNANFLEIGLNRLCDLTKQYAAAHGGPQMNNQR